MYESVKLPIESLLHYAEHPFREYTGTRLEDMVKSIAENGVLVPIIVRSAKTESGKFEILSGHNRVNAAREAGLNEVPAIVRDDLNDEEARLIVTETNLIQRSFADLSHSEKAAVIAMHYSALKRSKRRDDLIKEVEDLLSPLGLKAKKSIKSSVRDVGAEYGLSKNTIARYLRVDKLISELKARLDGNDGVIGDKLSMRTAVSLSYLRESEQKIVDKLLSGLMYHIDMRKAQVLREQAADLRKQNEKVTLTESDIKQVLDDSSQEKRHRSVKIMRICIVNILTKRNRQLILVRLLRRR